MKKDSGCPCESGRTYSECCKRFLDGALADSAEQLMRSRYCAFVCRDENYLLQSWHPDTRPKKLDMDDPKWIKWTGLRVISHEPAGDSATVEFVARYKRNGKAEKIHEKSRFIRLLGRWFYLDGDNID